MGVAIQPIFKDASQALRLSYAIEAYPATPQSQMGSVIRTLMRQCGIPAEHRQPSADFGNMTPLEVRAELGKLREIVKMQLNIIEARALQAKYSQNQGEQYKAMRTIWDHLRPVVAHVAKDHELVFSVVERHYQPEENRDAQWSVRAIADKFKVSKDRVFRLAKLVEQHIGQLELVALDNLRRELEQKKLFNHATEVA